MTEKNFRVACVDIIGVGLGVVFEEFDEAMCKECDVKRLKASCKLIILQRFNLLSLHCLTTVGGVFVCVFGFVKGQYLMSVLRAFAHNNLESIPYTSMFQECSVSYSVHN